MLQEKLFCCKIKELLAQFQRVYDELKDKQEIAIIEKYYYIARRYTTILIGKTDISTFL
jgi:hypothetical protein